MSTLILSDLHLGMASGRDLLRRAGIRAALREHLDGVERLVLLGDAVELRHGPLTVALAAARPFFEELGAALGDAEVVLVPGNHDHRLLAAWHERRRARAGGALALEQRILPREDEPAGTLAAWLQSARLTLAYPGLWLRPDVYAMHGHYLDRHVTLPTLERLAIGGMGWFAGRLPQLARPDDYEAALAPLYAWLHEVAQRSASSRRRATGEPALWRRLGPGRGDRPPRLGMFGEALPLVIAALNRLGLGPLTPDVAVGDLEVAGLRAMRETCERLGLDARFVIFGHMHRAGPRPEDGAAAWTAPTGARLVNTGSWIHEPALVAGQPPGSAYWPGTGVRLDAAGPPQIVRMLDHLSAAELPAPAPPLERAPPAVRRPRGRAVRSRV